MKCKDCGKRNYPGKVYCVKCSGDLYNKNIDRNLMIYASRG